MYIYVYIYIYMYVYIVQHFLPLGRHGIRAASGAPAGLGTCILGLTGANVYIYIYIYIYLFIYFINIFICVCVCMRNLLGWLRLGWLKIP